MVQHRAIDSILFNISGRILMIQQDLPNRFGGTEVEEEVQVRYRRSRGRDGV